MEFRRAAALATALVAAVCVVAALAGSALAGSEPKAPTVTQQPKSVTVQAGTSATFTSASSGSPTPTIQWQSSTNSGATWSNIPGATSKSYVVSAPTISQSGTEYRAVFTNSQGSATSSAATMTVTEKPTVTTQPVEAVVVIGHGATFESAATGVPPPTVQWQLSTNGGTTWTSIGGATSPTLNVGIVEEVNDPAGTLYRALWKNSGGETASNPALLVVERPPAFVIQPEPQSAEAGHTATFTAEGTGSPTPSEQWQVSTDGGTTWTNIEGANSAKLTVNATGSSMNGYEYRAVLANAAGTATSFQAKLTVLEAPTITAQPQEASVVLGQPASFESSATGVPTPSVTHWEVSTTDGASWAVVSGQTSPKLTLAAVTAGMSGNLYRAVWSNQVGSITTQAATLNVEIPPTVTGQPASATVEAGTAATFRASGSGSPPPGFQWQRSTDGGKTWSNIEGATEASYTVASTATGETGNQFRAVLTNVAGSATTEAASLSVDVPPAVTTQPSSATFEEGETATFSAVASGFPTPTVQWEVSTSGGSKWSAIAGATSTTLSLPAIKTSEDGRMYRAKFTNIGGAATTNAATLSVVERPTVTQQPTALTVTTGASATFEAAASGYPAPTAQWQRSGDGGKTWANIEGATAGKLTLTAVTFESNSDEYRAVFSNGAGSATSSAATLTVRVPSTIVAQPEWQTLLAGEPASFTAEASGYPDPTVQWERSTNSGATWTSIAGATEVTYSANSEGLPVAKSTYTISAAGLAESGYEFRARFANSAGSATSELAKLTVSANRYQAVGWGQNTFRQLGDGQSNASSPLPTTVAHLNFVKSVAAGSRNGAALLEDGTVRAWGSDEDGQLGTGVEGQGIASVPVKVEGLSAVTAIAVGENHMLALLQNGTVKAWGDGEQGQLGDGTSQSSTAPVTVQGLSNVQAIAAAGNVSMALLQNGTVKVWGNNELGQLGDGSNATKSTTPVTVSGLSAVTAISAGGEFELAVSGGKVWSWGSDEFGQLGTSLADESEGGVSTTPVEAEGLSGITQVAAGTSHALALSASGTVYAWGQNAQGELGNGQKQPFVTRPAAVSGLGEATAIAAGNQYSLALLASGHLDAWGSNANGVLGNGGYGASTTAPAPVAGLGEVKLIAAGEDFALADGEPIPTITGLSPSIGGAIGGEQVQITGVNLATVSSVTFGSTPALSFAINSNTSITAEAPPGTGVVDVHVSSPAGESTTVPADHFTYQELPQVGALSEKKVSAQGGQMITITGRNFTAARKVEFGGVQAPEIHVLNEHTINAVVPPHVAGTSYVRVTNSDGRSGEEVGGRITFEPSLTAISPSSGPAGTAVTITGYGFAPGVATMSVKFGKKASASVDCESETICTVLAPALPAGADAIQVTLNKTKTALTPADIFTYTTGTPAGLN